MLELFTKAWRIFLQGFNEFPWIDLGNYISGFIFYYPLVMSYVWIIGAIIYYFLWERRDGDTEADMPLLREYPPVSILIPCYNEGGNIRETLEFLLLQKYPHYEIVAINDGSRDNTLEILRILAAKHDKIRIIHLDANQGKAMALRPARC